MCYPNDADELRHFNMKNIYSGCVRYTDKSGDHRVCWVSYVENKEAVHRNLMRFLESPDSDWDGREIKFEYIES